MNIDIELELHKMRLSNKNINALRNAEYEKTKTVDDNIDVYKIGASHKLEKSIEEVGKQERFDMKQSVYSYLYASCVKYDYHESILDIIYHLNDGTFAKSIEKEEFMEDAELDFDIIRKRKDYKPVELTGNTVNVNMYNKMKAIADNRPIEFLSFIRNFYTSLGQYKMSGEKQ